MDLQSIAPATKTVPLGRGTVELTGVSLRQLAEMVVRHPELLALAAGKVDFVSLTLKAPEAMLSIAAAGIVGRPRRWWRFWSGDAGHDEMLRAFDSAAAGQQIEIVTQIFELTFAGESARPFLAAVLGMIGESQDAETPEAETPAPPGPPPSSS